MGIPSTKGVSAFDLHQPEQEFHVAEVEEKRSTTLQEHPAVVSWRKCSYYWSTALLIFATTVVIYGIGKQWNNPPWEQKDTHPVLEIFIFLVIMWWIALLEGCQISIVGLQAVNVEKYKDEYPRSYRSSKLVHSGPNVERFLVGRQFLLIFNGFLASKIAGAKRTDDFYMGDWTWSSEATDFFWSNSVLLMIVIVAPGQLVTQLLACDKMLGFFELVHGAYYTVVLPCLFVESLGMTHSSYLLKDVLCYLAGIDQSEGDPKKKMNKDFFYYFRCLLSVCLVIFSGVLIIKGIAMQQTGVNKGVGWEKLPVWAAVLIALLFLFIMACAEGLQVSALALAKTKTSTFKKRAPLAYRTTQILYAGRNMQAFMVGRQFFVAMMMVLLAKVTSYAGEGGELDGESNNDWGFGKGFNEGLLQTGFLGALFVCNVAQLASQVTASIFPVALINNRILNFLLQLMLLTEASGIVNSCWPIAWAVDSMCNLKKDPFDDDENVDTPAHNIQARQKSMGIPSTKGLSAFDLHQPDREYHIQYTLPEQFHENVSGTTASAAGGPASPTEATLLKVSVI